tara:strand:- start:237 stop:515 length:279 start_codon:yes stop_codon:yes gene_type:complete
LAEIDPQPKLKQLIHDVLSEIVVRCAKQTTVADKRAVTLDLTEVYIDWNTAEGISSEIDYRKTALGQLFTDDAFPLQAACWKLHANCSTSGG